MRARFVWMLGMMLALSACGGGADPGTGLCAAEAKTRMGDQVFRLDESLLTKETQPDGNLKYRGEVKLNPGTPRETTQTFDCMVAPASGNTPARVINFQFNW